MQKLFLTIGAIIGLTAGIHGAAHSSGGAPSRLEEDWAAVEAALLAEGAGAVVETTADKSDMAWFETLTSNPATIRELLECAEEIIRIPAFQTLLGKEIPAGDVSPEAHYASRAAHHFTNEFVYQFPGCLDEVRVGNKALYDRVKALLGEHDHGQYYNAFYSLFANLYRFEPSLFTGNATAAPAPSA